MLAAVVVHIFRDAPEPGAPQIFVTGAPVELVAPLPTSETLPS